MEKKLERYEKSLKEKKKRLNFDNLKGKTKLILH